ncbi:hypothetical protein RND81_11G146200 [Saponaria officinalis]|uniref:Uncharacterized protein n=1 Tax=Saponaria officinalis TaxID=3572 RepID=A0AAW1HN73_SAPOF
MVVGGIVEGVVVGGDVMVVSVLMSSGSSTASLQVSIQDDIHLGIHIITLFLVFLYFLYTCMSDFYSTNCSTHYFTLIKGILSYVFMLCFVGILVEVLLFHMFIYCNTYYKLL